MNFKLHSQFKPTGDQPQAIEKLTQGLNMGPVSYTHLDVYKRQRQIKQVPRQI